MDLWSIYTKLNSTLTGRDSIFRLIQYSSHLVHYVLKDFNSNINTMNKLKNMESSFSLARKFLRLFRVFEVLDKAIASLSIPDTVIQATTSLSYINTCLYYLSDHMVWLGKTGIHEVNNQKWSKLNNKFWFITVIMNVTKLIYELRNIISKELSHSMLNVGCDFSPSLTTKLIKIIIVHRFLFFDLLKNLCDLLVILTFLGHIELHGRTIGLLGIISSIITIVFVFKKG
ncbi:Peroxisomal membrane protein 11B [Nymphon striatum]|nr:Peroxisomal membrane protein 11B [Nymphon striatum]